MLSRYWTTIIVEQILNNWHHLMSIVFYVKKSPFFQIPKALLMLEVAPYILHNNKEGQLPFTYC